MKIPMDEDLMDIVNGDVSGKSMSFDRALLVQVLRELKKKETQSPAAPSVPDWITLTPSKD